MSTPQTDFIPLFDISIAPDEIEHVADALRSGWLTMGPRIAELEERFAEHLGCEHAVAVSSCTAALHLAYLAAGIGPGDEVIVPSYTFAATAAAVLYCGGTPVFADIKGPHDLGIDAEHVRELITPRTRAVTCMHFGGYANDMDALTAVCDEHGIALIEDVAHAPAATYGGKMLGTFGKAGCFSFFSNKVLPVGEGGLLSTNDAEVAAKARSLRSHAMTTVTWERHRGHAESYDITDVGFNYRMDEPRAALLLARLPKLGAEIDKRRALTRRYRELLAEVPQITVPYTDEAVEVSSCYVLPILIDDPAARGDVRINLRERHGVQTSLFYPPVHKFTAYSSRYPGISLPRTEDASSREITIPLFSTMTDEQQDRVVEALRTELGA